MKWLAWLYSPILQKGYIFVYMFALGWLYIQLEVSPDRMVNKSIRLILGLYILAFAINANNLINRQRILKDEVNYITLKK